MRKVIFLSIIVSSILGELTRIYLGNSIGISLLDIVSFFSLIYVIFLYVKNKNDQIFSNLKYFLFFIGICFLSLLLNLRNFTVNQILISSLYLWRFISYFSIYFLAKKLWIKNKKLLINSLFIWGISFIVLGFLQYILYPNLRNLYYLGWDDHLYRLFSTFLDPDFAGVFIASFIIYLFTFFKKRNKKINIIIPISIIISFISLLLTYSRGAFIAFFISLIILVFISKNKIYKYLLGIFILFFILFAAFFTNSKLEPINLLRTYSISQRFISLNHAFTIFSKSPIWGIGFNTYRYEQEKLGFLKNNSDISHAGAGTDNSFIFILATTGVIGLFFYLLLFKKLLQKFWKSSLTINSKQSNYHNDNKFIFCSILTVFIGSLFVNALFYPPIMVWTWSLVVIIDYNSRE